MKFVKSKIFLAVLQIIILSFMVITFSNGKTFIYNPQSLDIQKFVVSFLATYVIYQTAFEMMFLYFSWLAISLIPVIVYHDYKKAYSLNLTIYFIFNFFFYIFLNRYAESSFRLSFTIYFVNSVILGLIIIAFSICLAIISNKLIRFKQRAKQDSNYPSKSLKVFRCPNCGTEFNSYPIYCYNCNEKLPEYVNDDENK
jgi:hypothetical protein